MNEADPFSFQWKFAITLASLALVAIVVTLVFRRTILSNRPSRLRWLKSAWVSLAVCMLSGLWLLLALAGASAAGIADPMVPSIRVPGMVQIISFVLGTGPLLVLLLTMGDGPGHRGDEEVRGTAAVPATAGAAVDVFVCHGDDDERLRDELEKHLTPLVHGGFVTLWHEGKLAAGTELEQKTNELVDRSKIVIALTTASLLSSEAAMAQIARARARGTKIVPVIAEACLWEVTELGSAKPLPPNKRPVAAWSDRNAAWLEVVQGVLDLVKHPEPSTPNA